MTWGNKRTPAQAARAFRSAETRRNKVRAFCSEHSMTRAEFAEKAEIAPTTLQRFMSGTMQTGSFAYSKSEKFMKRYRLRGK